MNSPVNNDNDESYTLANFKVVKSVKEMKQRRQKQQQKQHQVKCQQLLDNFTPNYVLGYN